MYVSQTHFGFTKIGSKMPHFRAISAWKVKNVSGTPCNFLTNQILVKCKQSFDNILQEGVDKFMQWNIWWSFLSSHRRMIEQVWQFCKLQNCSQILAKLWWLQKRLNHTHKNQMLNLPQQLLIARFFFCVKKDLNFKNLKRTLKSHFFPT